MNVRFISVILVLLAVLLIASLALNYYLFDRGLQYYMQLNETRLDPLGLSFYPTNADQRDLINLNRTTVVFFGDSRAANWPAPAALDEIEFINRGIGAQTSTQVAQRFDYHLKPLQPQIVILQAGINDLKTIPLFPDQKERIVANCKANIQQIVSQSVASGATVILTTIFPVGKAPIERKPLWSDDVAASVDEVNAYIHALTEDDVVIFDAYSILADDDGTMKAEYSEDELHINDRGYEALNNELATILSAWDNNEE